MEVNYGAPEGDWKGLIQRVDPKKQCMCVCVDGEGWGLFSLEVYIAAYLNGSVKKADLCCSERGFPCFPLERGPAPTYLPSMSKIPKKAISNMSVANVVSHVLNALVVLDDWSWSAIQNHKREGVFFGGCRLSYKNNTSSSPTVLFL